MDEVIVKLVTQTPNDAELGNLIRKMYWDSQRVKIYESPDKGKTVYSRNVGEMDKTLVRG